MQFPLVNDHDQLFGALDEGPKPVFMSDVYWGTPFEKDMAMAVKYFGELKPKFQAMVSSAQVQPIKHSLFGTVRFGERVKVFEGNQDKVPGLRNVDKGKLDSNTLFLCTGISILTGATTINGSTPTKDELGQINYGSIGNIPQIANGKVKVELGKKTVVHEDCPLSEFVTDGKSDVTVGYRQLSRPVWVTEGQELNAEFEFLTVTGVPATSFIRIIFHGIAFVE